MTALARWCFTRRAWILVAWLALLVILGVAGRAAGAVYSDSLTLPGTGSTTALTILEKAFPGHAGDQDTIVWRAGSGSVDAPAVRTRITAMLGKVAAAPAVASVISPYSAGGAAQVSRNGQIAYATVVFDAPQATLPAPDITRVVSLAEAARAPGVQVDIGGPAVENALRPSVGISAAVGVVAAAVVLFIAFGSLLSMLLPLIIAIAALVSGLMTVDIVSHAVSIPSAGPTLGILIGLGVGIDYALFIVTRHRNNLKAGMSPKAPPPPPPTTSAIPRLPARRAPPDAASAPAPPPPHQAYELLADGSGPGFNGPLQLAGTTTSPAGTAAFTRLAGTLKTVPGIAAASAPVPGDGASLISVTPTTSPEAKATSTLISQLRGTVIPAAEHGTTLRVYVGGVTGDFAALIAPKLLVFIAVILVLGFLLLMLAFRSLLIPAVAAVMNLLAAAASFGVLVAVFQYGWGLRLLNLGQAGPVESFVPVLMLAVLFGLSMDYEVFLVSRYLEEWDSSVDNHRAVLTGLSSTYRGIIAAAAVISLRFSPFIQSGH